jgi:hypothetical protein
MELPVFQGRFPAIYVAASDKGTQGCGEQLTSGADKAETRKAVEENKRAGPVGATNVPKTTRKRVLGST